MSEWIGHWHPVMVHLPIGFVVLACLFILASRGVKYAFLNPVVPLILWLSFLVAFLAVLSGLMLAEHGDYAPEQVFRHQWAGIATAASLLVLAFFYQRGTAHQWPGWVKNILALGLLAILTVTGHWGGVLTHGEHYLWPESEEAAEVRVRTERPLVFEQVVYPLFKTKCLKCHNQNKRKGGLALHTLAAVQQGGKNGPVLNQDEPAQSELLRRVSLPVDHEDFMPKGKKQGLTADELALLGWWLSLRPGGADLALEQVSIPDSLQIILAAKGYTGEANNLAVGELTNLQVPRLDDQVLTALQAAGIHLKKIHRQPDLADVVLSSSFHLNDGEIRTKLRQLEAIKDNIYWLNLSGLKLNDQHLTELPACTNLKLLNLADNNLTDEVGRMLSAHKNLEALILHHTQVTAGLLSHLQTLPQLKKVYVWQTGISPSEVNPAQYSFQCIFGE